VNLGLKQVAIAVMDASVAYEVVTVHSHDHAEAVKAFLEKRKPVFIGKQVLFRALTAYGTQRSAFVASSSNSNSFTK
jgi:hypothetical protein